MHRLVVWCLCVIILVVSSVSTQRKLPSFVPLCKRFDPELDKCWVNTINKLKPYLAKGIPEFDVPATSNFYIEKIHLEQSNTQNVNFAADLLNTTFYGGENFDVVYTKTDFENLMLRHELVFPKLTSLGMYKAKGKILVFEFEGEGALDGLYENVHVNGTWWFKIIKKKGKEYLQIERDHIDVAKPEKLVVNFDNLFRGNAEISRNVNKAINDNVDLIYDEVKPLLDTTISTVFTQYFNRFYSLYPYDVILPKD